QELLEARSERSARFGSFTARVLGSMGPSLGTTTQPPLQLALRDEDVSVRRAALAALAKVVPDRKSLIPIWTEVLSDPDASVQVQAASGLWEAGNVKEAFPTLVAVLGTRDQNAINQANQILYKIGPERRDLIPAVIDALKNDNQQVQYQILGILQRLGPAGRDAIPAVVPLLKHKEQGIRQYAVSVLSQIGPGSKEVVPVLVE